MSALLGCQTPTFSTGPKVHDSRTADEAIELAAAAGVTLLDWQAALVHRILGQRPDQQWATTRIGFALPRQNGKGVVLEVVVLAKVVLLGERVLWTAHEVRTMQEAFTRFRSLLEASTDLSRLVASTRTANGQERIVLHNGAEVKFSARSKSAARGLGFRTLVFDETQELDYLTLGAIVPTLSGQGDARTQQVLCGTPPYSAKGEVFADLRAAAHTGGDQAAAWWEWAADPTDRLDDRGVWARTNPSLGVVVREEKIVDELATLTARPDVFRRERLGEWGRTSDAALALDPTAWAGGAAPRPAWGERDERYLYGDSKLPVVFVGIDSSFNNELVSVVQAVPLPDELVGLDVLAAAPGLDWLTPWLADLRTVTSRVIVAYDPLRVGDLGPDLRAAGIRDGAPSGNNKRIHPASSRTLTTACEALVRAVREHRVRHHDPRLDAAAATAVRSTYDDGRGWKLIGADGADVHTLIAGALAAQALRGWTPRRSTTGRSRVVVLS